MLATKPEPEPTTLHEAAFRITRVDALWRAGSLQTLDVDGTLLLRSFLTVDLRKPAKLDIKGRLNRKSQTVSFRGTFLEPVALLPRGTEGPIRQVWVKGVDIALENNKPKALVDGRIELGEMSLPGVDLDRQPRRPRGFQRALDSPSASPSTSPSSSTSTTRASVSPTSATSSTSAASGSP